MRHLEINDRVTFYRTESGRKPVPGAIDAYPATGEEDIFIFVIRDRCVVVRRHDDGKVLLENPTGRCFVVDELDPRLKPDGWIALFVRHAPCGAEAHSSLA